MAAGAAKTRWPFAPCSRRIAPNLDSASRGSLSVASSSRARTSLVVRASSSAAMRDRIREELPSLFNLFRADAYLLKRIVASAGTLLEEVRADPDHPMRQEFDRFVKTFIERLKSSKDYRRRAEKLKRDFLARPQMRDMVEGICASLRAVIEQDARADDSAIRRHLTGMFVEIGRHLRNDPDI